MKRHKFWIFTGPADGSGHVETWHGDCPKWRDSVRAARPDLTMTTGVVYGPRMACACCALGLTH